MAHIPVLLQESLNGLAIRKGGIYVDCTTNRGGHSIEIAKQVGKKGVLICIDLDQEALNEAKKQLAKLKDSPTIHFVHSNFRHLSSILKELKIDKVDGVLADLGISSQELDDAKRGFTFRYDEPLLMTFDSKPGKDTLTASDIVNSWSEESLADIFYGFADERYARRIARAIVKYRVGKEITTTFQLLDIISSSVPALYKNKKTHFATKTFQALRMATNDELGSIKDLINSLPDVLQQEGRASIITFHSTEDRIVKQELRARKDLLTPVTKKPIIPTKEEIQNNPRSRSAQLRIIEKSNNK